MHRYSRSYEELVTEDHDCCEHLKIGQRAALTCWEHDRFGPLTARSFCKACALKDEQYAEEERERADEEFDYEWPP